MLFLSAFAPELQRFRELRPSMGSPGELTREIGVGPVAAAVGAARALGAHPSPVVLLGTCGAYPGSALAIADLVVVRTSRLVDPSVVRGTSTAIHDDVLDTDEALATRFAAVGREVVCATTLSLTTDDDLARAIAAATGAHVEHLETHAVALACASFGVPFVALLAVANHVGANGRVEWREHHRSVENALGEAAASLLEKTNAESRR